MKKFSINDWLTIQTRKDITLIRRSIEHESVDFAIFIEMFIAVLSFALDHLLWTVVDPTTGAVEQVAPSWFWIITFILLFIAPFVVFFFGYRKKVKFQDDFKKVKPVEVLMDLFDNEICYNAMTSDSMRDQFKDQSGTIEEEIREFYFIEAAYYANKAVSQLFHFKIQGANGIQTPESVGGISFIRFWNICKILSNIYHDLEQETKKNEKYMPLFRDSVEYIKSFNDLLNHMGGIVPELSELKNMTIDTALFDE